jgi:PleD family two-component response regulator
VFDSEYGRHFNATLGVGALMSAADVRLYKAKEAGRNRIISG